MNNSGAGILWPASDHSRRESWQLWPSHRSISIAACKASFCPDLARTYSPDRIDTFRAALCSIRWMVWFFSSLIMDHRQAGYSRNYIKLCPARRISLPPPPAPPTLIPTIRWQRKAKDLETVATLQTICSPSEPRLDDISEKESSWRYGHGWTWKLCW